MGSSNLLALSLTTCAMLWLLTLGVICVGVSYGSCLPCGVSPCQTPVCCKSREYVRSGYCGCCLECAKKEGEECGGQWGEKGKCGADLICTPRLTDYATYECMKATKSTGGLGYSKSGLISNTREPSKAEVIPAPVCPAGKAAKDMACHCSKETAVKGLDGNMRGGCVPPPNNFNHGWCFLENIRNPENMTKNCFEDAKWSVVDGRFWSRMACEPVLKDGNQISVSDDVPLDLLRPKTRIMDLPDIDKECHGSVRLSEDTVVTKDTDIKPKMDVKKVLVEGCGCFRLFAKKKGKGRSSRLLRAGEWEGIMKVGSVRKEEC